MMEVFGADGTKTLVFENGSTTPIPPITKDEGPDDSGYSRHSSHRPKADLRRASSA
jgi:hypothetical protein